MGTQIDLFDAFDRAQTRMEMRFKAGEAQEQKLIEEIGKTIIVDKLVPPKGALFLRGDAGVELGYGWGTSKVSTVTVHRHALGQLCEKAKVPMTWVNTLQLAPANEEGLELLAHTLNWRFQKKDFGDETRFLHRIVGNELRGFLSRRFNRHLASAPLLRSFVEQCRVSGACPVEATTSSVCSALKCFMPTVFEAFKGEYICVGVEWRNSDFGAATLTVRQTLWRVGAGTAAVVDEGLRKRHIGSIIEDSDVEMSDETAIKEVAAQQSAVRDHVKEYTSEKSVQRLLEAIRTAHEKELPWTGLRSKLKGILTQKQLDDMKSTLDEDGIIDLPPVSYTAGGERTPNAYWASAYVSTLASKSEDTDRRLELQQEAGKLLAAAMAA